MIIANTLGVSCLLALGACASEARQEPLTAQDAGAGRPRAAVPGEPAAATAAPTDTTHPQPSAATEPAVIVKAEASKLETQSITPPSATTATPEDVAQPKPPSDLPASEPDDDACQRGTIEPDLFAFPLDGPGVSGGALQPGNYMMSSTYLRLRENDAASSKFWELMLPIFDDLANRDGLVALSLGLSAECNSARTLSVWRDDEAMLDFVVSPAHGAAVAAIFDLSRGGSIATHWMGNETRASWDVAAQQLAQDDGPFY